MSCWDDIDALKKRFEDEMDATRTEVTKRCDPRAANSLKITTGGLWRVLWQGKELTSRTSAGLLEQLPKPKPTHSLG